MEILRRIQRDCAATHGAMQLHVGTQPAYERYPTYAALLALATCLFVQFPMLTPLDFALRSPLLLALGATVALCASTLAFALGFVGLWRPGRVNAGLSLLAMLMVCLPAS